jgi:NAD(P)-dependent dehydrogenase (short-subunit alcohol dehydrogenase family)
VTNGPQLNEPSVGLGASRATPGDVDAELSGQVALVTGGSRGIGLAVAGLLARRGARVIIAPRDVAAAEHAASGLRSSGLDCSAIGLDVREESEVRVRIDELIERFGSLDILVNNAGTSGAPANLWETSTEFFDGIMRVHLYGTFFCIRAVVPHMLRVGYGRIVNMASVAGKEGNPQKAPYSAAKAAVIGLTKSVAKELATSGVIVNAVAPTIIETELLEQSDSEHIAMLTAKIPMGRRGRSDEVAELVAFAASPRCSFTTGAVFDASGGRMTY